MTASTALPLVDLGPTGALTAARGEVLAAASRIEEIAEGLLRRSGRVGAISGEVGLSAGLSPGSAALCEAALATALFGPAGLLAVARSLDLTASAARAAIGVLAEADDGLQFLGPLESLAGASASAVLTGTALGGGLRALVVAYAGTEGHARITSAAPITGAPPGSLVGLLDRLDRVNALPAGTIEVLTVAAPDGSRRHVVTLPGTDGVDRDLVRSLPTDAAIRTGQVTTYERGILAAMRASGVRAGEPVVLVGHSMGGMVAAEIARHDTGFRITHVVTAGSPIGDRPLPPGVRLLALEHTADPVPRLDGARLPDVERHRVTATFTDTGVGPRNPHDLAHYRRGAALATVSPDALVREAVHDLEDVLGDDVHTQSRVWRISRKGG